MINFDINVFIHIDIQSIDVETVNFLYLTPLTILSRSALILSWQRDLITSRSGDLTGDFLYIACLMLVTRGELGTVELTDIVTKIR